MNWENVAGIVVIGCIFGFLFMQVIGAFRRSGKEDKARRLRIQAREEKANRPSQFDAVRLSPTDTRYSCADITVTCKTNLATREVSFEWSFSGSPAQRRVDLTYTSSLDALQQRVLDEDDAIEALGNAYPLLLFAALAADKDEAKEKPVAVRPPVVKDATNSLQPFAPQSTLLRGHASKVLPEGTWYIRFKYSVGSTEDKFEHTVLLDKSVREGKPYPTALSIERHVEEGIKHIVDSMGTLQDGIMKLNTLDESIENLNLPQKDKAILHKEVQSAKEKMIRGSKWQGTHG
jgi:hypothetical protein